MAVFKKTKCLTDKILHYCPGCGHGIVQRLVAECIDELHIKEKTIGVAPVGDAVFAYNYYDIDMCQAAHGRAPAMATGIKRMRPENIVFTYQGDGDLASIGMAETVHAAARNENITIIFINNAIYGMTGGQMAPTTLMGQKSKTCQEGRNAINGYTINVCELLAALKTHGYVERVSVHNVKHIISAKHAIKKAFENQINNNGFSIIEVLANCPTNLGFSPQDSMRFIEEQMILQFPLGVFKSI